jgi:hypothetical protein
MERPADEMRLRVNIAGESRLTAEGVKENAAQIFHGLRRRVNRHPVPIRRTESPEVVKSHDVVSVGMRIHNGVHFPDARSERLQAKLRAGVDYPATGRGFDVNRRPETAISRILRTANWAVA